MKFQIRRASRTSDKDPVFPGAYLEGKYWYVEITSLDQLTSQVGNNTSPTREKDFAWDEQGVVLWPKHWETGFPEIKIYDDWIE